MTKKNTEAALDKYSIIVDYLLHGVMNNLNISSMAADYLNEVLPSLDNQEAAEALQDIQKAIASIKQQTTDIKQLFTPFSDASQTVDIVEMIRINLGNRIQLSRVVIIDETLSCFVYVNKKTLDTVFNEIFDAMGVPVSKLFKCEVVKSQENERGIVFKFDKNTYEDVQRQLELCVIYTKNNKTLLEILLKTVNGNIEWNDKTHSIQIRFNEKRAN